jgi:probable F420-dependent oxidoreductase
MEPRNSHVSVMLANIGGIDDYRRACAAVVEADIGRIWMAETRGPDALITAAILANEFPLEVGTAIVSVSARTPATLAIAVADVAELSQGRPVHLGLGAGGQVIVEGWHGVSFRGSVGRVRDTIAILRQAFAGERTDHHGEQQTSSGLRLAKPPGPGQVVLYVGGMGPKMLRLASEVADGLILTWVSPRIVSTRFDELREAERALGREPRSVRVVARVYVAVTDDVSSVRQGVRNELVEYIVSPPYAIYFRSVGFAGEVDAVIAAFARGDRAGTAAGVSDYMLDELLVAGSAGAVREALRKYIAAGADDVLVQAVPPQRGGDPIATIRALHGL